MSDQISRREFLRVGGALAAGTALAGAGCKPPMEATVPFHDMPENLAAGLGKARFYTTVLNGRPVLVRTREGRPLLVTPNPADPGGAIPTLREQAALMDLYDPDRAVGPLSVRRGQGAPVAAGWAAVGAEVVRRLKSGPGETVLLTEPDPGPSLRAAIAELAAATGLRHLGYAPIQADAVATAWIQAYGTASVPRPRLDRAGLILGFGAEFIDRPEHGLEADFAARRAPDRSDRPMSRFVQLEGRLTLTGANADQRLRVRDSQLAAVAAAVAHQLIVVHRHGPLAGDAGVVQALSPFEAAAVAGPAGLDPGVIPELARHLLAAGDRAIVLAGGSASDSASGVALETAVLLINHTLNRYGAPVFDEAVTLPLSHGGSAALASLAAEIRSGQVGTLLIAGPNPGYDAPPGLAFAAALERVDLVVSLNDRLDETARHADYLVPASQPFECWADASLPGGRFAVQQPVIRPLYETHGLLDVLVAWGAAAGAGGRLAVAAGRARAAGATTVAGLNPSGAYHYVRAWWAEHLLGQAVDSPAFEAVWNESLRVGFRQGESPPVPPRTLAATAVAALGTPASPPSELELQLHPGCALGDGRNANNGWLQELPDPVSRISWGNAVAIAPRRFDAMGLRNGDRVEIKTAAGVLVLPAYRHAGMHHDQLAVALGYGRTACGAIGGEVGGNAFILRSIAEDGRTLAAGLPVTLRRADGHEELALAQGSDVIDRDRRPLVPVTTLTAFERDPRAGTEQQAGGPSAWADHPYPGPRWGMAIDLSRCNGCGRCVLGCQAENNVPVVGREAIIAGREMSWLRIDRYYDAPARDGRWGAEVWDGPLEVVEEPVTLFEPMLCQHCENAPCETVCPFTATMHSEDGLNQQVYNRCVGTRYCANNCPFKVRRFNWYEYSWPKGSGLLARIVPQLKRHAELNSRGRMQMKNNPEVTVRSRGVMEKCSFCLQRVREARAEAIRAGRPKDRLPDGAVVPACMEACPTGAIVFGDLNNPESEVSALSRNPRAMKLLEALGVKPSISYLSKVRHDRA
ncbi:MAG: 4Fe-4S dicluster domain-containing protein [Candidatus Latescibacterota bacterium]